jgi:hypothetical protein
MVCIAMMRRRSDTTGRMQQFCSSHEQHLQEFFASHQPSASL